MEHKRHQPPYVRARTGKAGGRASSLASGSEDGAEDRRGVARRTGGVEAIPAKFVPPERDKTSGVRAPLLEEGHDSGGMLFPTAHDAVTGRDGNTVQAKTGYTTGNDRERKNVLERTLHR